MNSKKGIIISLAVTIILLVTVVFGYLYIYGNDYVIKVNGEKVTMVEFNVFLRLQKKILEKQLGQNVWDTLIKDAPAIETARNSAKDSIVDTKLKLQQARKLKVTLTSEEKEKIKKAVENDLAVALAKGIDLLKEYDITQEELTKIYEDANIISKLEIELYKQTDHSTHEHGAIDIDKFAAEEETDTTIYDSRHILLKTQGKTEKEAEEIKKKAEAILNRVKAGEDFANLAKEFSEDGGSKENGGLYIGTGIGQFVSEYERAALSLEPGEIYPDLVKTSYGYHIIKLEGVTKSGYLNMKDTQTVLTTELEEKAKEWFSTAKIEINEQQYNSAQ